MYRGSNRLGRLVALAATAVVLCGCAGSDYGTGPGWFSKPLDLFGSKNGYTFSALDEEKQQRPITANDLVDANGACPRPAPPPSSPANPTASPAVLPDGASLLGGGVAIGMSECDVVARAGQPTTVTLGRNPNGDRTAVLTFTAGPRPGIYRFVAGRLTEMDSVGEPAPPAQPQKKRTAKKDDNT